MSFTSEKMTDNISQFIYERELLKHMIDDGQVPDLESIHPCNVRYLFEYYIGNMQQYWDLYHELCKHIDPLVIVSFVAISRLWLPVDDLDIIIQGIYDLLFYGRKDDAAIILNMAGDNIDIDVDKRTKDIREYITTGTVNNGILQSAVYHHVFEGCIHYNLFSQHIAGKSIELVLNELLANDRIDIAISCMNNIVTICMQAGSIQDDGGLNMYNVIRLCNDGHRDIMHKLLHLIVKYNTAFSICRSGDYNTSLSIMRPIKLNQSVVGILSRHKMVDELEILATNMSNYDHIMDIVASIRNESFNTSILTKVERAFYYMQDYLADSNMEMEAIDYGLIFSGMYNNDYKAAFIYALIDRDTIKMYDKALYSIDDIGSIVNYKRPAF